MFTFCLFFYYFMWISVSTLSLMSYFKKDTRPSGDEIIIYTMMSILKGSLWIVTIWVALAYWATTKRTPYWVEVLIKLFNFCRGKK